MMLVVIKLKYNDRKIRAKCNFATLKNFMTCLKNAIFVKW